MRSAAWVGRSKTMTGPFADRGRRKPAAGRPKTRTSRPGLAGWAVALPLIAAALLWGAQAARGASFTLEDGREIRGDIVFARGSTLMIREPSGAMVQVGRSAVRQVEIEAGKKGKVSGALVGWDQGVYEIDTADSVIKVKGRKVVEERRVLPMITVASAEESEAAARMVFELGLTKPAKAEVLLIYSTADGTAMAGSDYEAARGSVILAPGTTVTKVSITLLDDQLVEGDESFELLVTSDMDLSEVKVHRAAAKILDDEPPQAAQQ